MKSGLLIIIGMIIFSFITPQAFSDNEFCKIQENLKIQEELIKDNVVLIEFLKVFPNAKLIRANYVDESNPEQTSMTWIAGTYSLDIHIWGFDKNNPSDCFFLGGYRLNAPHLPNMIGLEYHKDPTIVLEQIDELEPKYVKGGPAPIDSVPIPEPTSQVKALCEDENTVLKDGICVPKPKPSDFRESGSNISMLYAYSGLGLVGVVAGFFAIKKWKNRK